MSKYTVENSHIIRERVVNIIKWEKKKNRIKGIEEFSEIIGVAYRHFSRMTGKKASRNITETIIDSIINHFPEYRKEYLLGIDEIPTHAEYDQIQFSKMIDEFGSSARKAFYASEVLSSIWKMAIIDGFHIEALNPIYDCHDSYTDLSNCGYKITKDNKYIEMNMDDLSAFENEICDYITFRLLHMMKDIPQEPDQISINDIPEEHRVKMHSAEEIEKHLVEIKNGFPNYHPEENNTSL